MTDINDETPRDGRDGEHNNDGRDDRKDRGGKNGDRKYNGDRKGGYNRDGKGGGYRGKSDGGKYNDDRKGGYSRDGKGGGYRGKSDGGKYNDDRKGGYNRDGKGGGYRGKSDDRKYNGDRNGYRGKRAEEPEEVKAPEPKQPTAKVKLRLDVKDIVRGNKADGEAAKSDETVAVENSTAEIAVEGYENIRVLYEDNHVLVVIKPRNMPSQADSSGDADLLSELKKYLIKKYDKPGDAYLGLLHRLDRPTGGVMVFAKTSKAAGRLSEQIRAGEFEKCYAAVVVGRPNKTGLVEHYLLKDEQNNIVTLAPSTMEGVKRAAAEIKLEAEKDELALVSVKLLTGRTHQARVQLKSLGCPIVGDVKYAGDKLVKAKNLALWAYKLVFAHPVSGEIMRFIAEPPQEFPWSEFDTDALVDIVRPVDRRGYNV